MAASGSTLLDFAFILSLIFPAAMSSVDINVVAVIDAMHPEVEKNIKDGVDYLNLPTGPLPVGYNVKLEVVLSRDNEWHSTMVQVCERLTGGVSLIIDISSPFVTKSLRAISDAIGIAHISALDPSVESTERTFNISTNVRPPESIMLHAIRDSVRQENLTNVGIIYDRTFDLDGKPKRLLRNIPAQHLYLPMATTEAAIDEQLLKIKMAELQHLFLASSSKNAERYLGQASAKGMMNFKYSWYVITKDTELACSACSRASAIVMTGKPSFSPLSTYVAMSENETLEVGAAFHFDFVQMIGKALNQMIVDGEWMAPNGSDCYATNGRDASVYQQSLRFKDTITRVRQDGVFGPILWSGDTAEQIITLEIRRNTFEEGLTVSSEIVGNWTKADHLYAIDGSITDKNVKKTYKVATLREPPFIFKEKKLPIPTPQHYYDAKTDYYYFGYCIDLIFKINETMNFDFVLIEPEDMAYGSMRDDGTWNGLVQELITERADIIVAPLSVMAERENVIDFTVPYYDLVGITILMKKPTFNYSVFKFLTVLEEAVWGCVFSAFIIVSVLLAVFDKFSPYSYQNNKSSWDGQGEEPRIFTLKEGLWFCMTSLTPQGGGEAPRALSGRLVAATWWMFGFIMIATYTANLAAFLTVSRLDQPIESLDDLAKQLKVKYAPQNSTSTATYFRRMADIEDKFYTIWKAMSLNDSLDQMERAKLAVWDYPVSDKFTNMWEAMKDSGFPQTFDEALARIKRGNDKEEYAFIGDATQNKYAMLTDCQLWEVGEEFSRKPYALAVQEGSPLKNELSSVILQLLNQRFLEDLKARWWEYNKTVCDKIEDESDGISIQNIGGVFLVIFIGIGLGLITLAFEYYWYRWRPQQQKQGAVNYDGSREQGKSIQAHDNQGYNHTT